MSATGVDTDLASETATRNGDDTTPTTPRPSTAPDSTQSITSRLDDAKTPTRATFALGNQKPLPTEPFPTALSVPESIESPQKPLSRGQSTRSSKSFESEDVDMDDASDGDDGEGSDDESVNADGTRSGKKKKSQRFWCTDYPPCNLSFTRSEHLARHIRKHTGERPFQCHCSRRFSRLDNLRQHAQTVHVNEEIPGDSLAATGTRFQRQVRTDRVRPPANRSRANTGGSQNSGGGRGHHRNSLSASSITSIGSSYSTTQDIRRRPTPLVMAGDPRNRFSVESYGSDQGFRPVSPGGFATPTSTTFSTGPNSPHYSSVHSPMSSHSRTASLYADHRTHARRLSVPSTANPFQMPHGYGPAPLTPMNASNSGIFMSPTGNLASSPTTSTSGSVWSRRDSVSSVGEGDWRRRTWHPETSSHFTSRLVNVTTPAQYQQHQQQSAPVPTQESLRLPGISSFDPLQRPKTPPRREPSPMMIDTPSRVPFPPSSREPLMMDRRQQPPPQYNVPLHRDMQRMELNQHGPPQDAASSWADEANRAVQAQLQPTRQKQGPTVRFEAQPYPPREQYATQYGGHPQHASAPPVTPRELKRQGWYSGPPPSTLQYDQRRVRTSPEDSSSSEGHPATPGSAAVSEYNPTIVNSTGWTEPQRPPQQPTPYGSYGSQGREEGYAYAPGGSNTDQGRAAKEGPRPDPMMRLEALVAVATSEKEPASAY